MRCRCYLILAFLALTISICSAQGEDEDLYKSLINEFSQNPTVITDLFEFSNRFPNSRYADDSLYLVILGCTAVGEKNDGCSMAIEKIIQNYSDQRLETMTIEVFKKKSAEVYSNIPYKLLPLAYEIAIAFVDKQHDLAARQTIRLIEQIDHNDPEYKDALWSQYSQALFFCKLAGREDDYEMMKKKTLDLFPGQKEKINYLDSSEFLQKVKAITEANRNKE